MNVRRAVVVFLSLFVPFAYFNHSDGWNQGARLSELHAIVLKGTLSIDAYHELTGDKALINGHYYSEKAPAVVLMALPAFGLTVLTQKLMGIDPDSTAGWRASQWVATAGSVGLLAALGGMAFFALLAPRLGAPIALLSTYAVFLGSLTFPYATAMFAHAATIGLLAIALWAALGHNAARYDYLAGSFAGLAVASEYPAIIPCTGLGLYLVHTEVPRAWRFGLALVPGAILIFAKNYLISGSPFQVSYGSNPAFPEITSGNSFGFNLPDFEAVAGLLWGEYRGLFFWCPVLLMAIPGLVILFKKHPPVAWMIAVVFVFIMIQVSSFYSWFGGNAVGPRYLAPSLPFLGLAAAYGIKRFPIPGAALALLSVVLMAMVSAVAIDPPQDVLTPLQSFYLVRVRDDRFAANLGTLLGANVTTSLLMLAAIVVAAATWIVVQRDRAAVTSE
jgi:MFS family permease